MPVAIDQARRDGAAAAIDHIRISGARAGAGQRGNAPALAADVAPGLHLQRVPVEDVQIGKAGGVARVSDTPQRQGVMGV